MIHENSYKYLNIMKLYNKYCITIHNYWIQLLNTMYCIIEQLLDTITYKILITKRKKKLLDDSWELIQLIGHNENCWRSHDNFLQQNHNASKNIRKKGENHSQWEKQHNLALLVLLIWCPFSSTSGTSLSNH